MTNTTRRTKIARMTLLAMLVAVLIVLAYVNIPMPMGLSITFNMIPVAIAVMAMGLPGGIVIGGVFGLISFLQCFGIVGYSAMGAALVSVSPFLMFIQRFVSRVLVGVITALIYRALKRRNVKDHLAFTITGFSAAFFNTLFFMSLLVLLFGSTEYLQNLMAGRGVLTFIIASVGINAVVEMIVAAVVTAAVGIALKKSKLI